jgi:CRISPR-associated protein Cas8b/Csh1 subtype I-B
VCNQQAKDQVHIPWPVDFLTLDQLVYVPNALKSNEHKAIPLCQACANKLRRGQAFIKNYLDFKISGSKVSFWLLPTVAEFEGFARYMKNLAGDHKPLYITGLKKLCQDIELLSEDLVGAPEESERADIEALLTFNSLFYYRDTQGHMRLLSSRDGIYPQRLQQIVNSVHNVNRHYPYFKLTPKIRFTFSLLKEFFVAGKRSAEVELAEMIGAIFTDGRISRSYVHSCLLRRVADAGPHALKTKIKGKATDLYPFVEIALKALIAMEFFAEIGLYDMAERDGGSVKSSITPEDPKVIELSSFLSNHRSITGNSQLGSIFFIGVAVGILLEAQKARFNKYPYWRHLNRLSLTPERLKSLYPDVMDKLHMYGDEYLSKFGSLLSFIGANIDPEFDKLAGIEPELRNLTFAIGLAEGYLLYHNDKGETR